MLREGQKISPSSNSDCFIFAGFRFSLRSRELEHMGKAVPIENKALDCLAYFIQQRDRAVSKQELHEVLWHNRPLSETVLSRCIMKVRRALNDDGQRQAIIKTIPGFGYRFIAPITVVGRETTAATPYAETDGTVTAPAGGIQNSSVLSNITFLILASLFLILATLFYVLNPLSPPTTPVRQLAVLPVQNATGNDSFNWVELGLMTLIEQSLSSHSGVPLLPYQKAITWIPDSERQKRRRTPSPHKVTSKIFNINYFIENNYLVDTSLQRENGVFLMHYTLYRPGAEPLTGTLIGDDAVPLSNALGKHIATHLDKGIPYSVPLSEISADNEVQQHFVSALEAVRNGDYASAKKFFENCLESDPESQWCRLELANLENKMTNWFAGVKLLKTILALPDEKGRVNLKIMAHNVYGELELHRGNYREAEKHFNKALEASTLTRNDGASAKILANLAKVYTQRGDFERAETVLNHSLSLSRKAGDQSTEAAALKQMGLVAFYLGHLSQAKVYSSTALYALYGCVCSNERVIDVLIQIGNISHEFNEFRQAETYFNLALTSSHVLGDQWREAKVAVNLARLKVNLGQLDKGSELLQYASSSIEHDAAGAMLPSIRLQYALVYANMGQLDQAITELQGVIQSYLTVQDDFLKAIITFKLGRLYLIQKNMQSAELYADKGMEIANRLKSPYLKIEAYRLLANVAHVKKDLELAHSYYRNAIILARGLEFARLMGDVIIEYGYLCLQKKEYEQAESLLASIKNPDGNYQALLLKARIRYHSGKFHEAFQLQLQAKQLAGGAWPQQAEKLIRIYQTANETGKSIPIENSFLPIYI